MNFKCKERGQVVVILLLIMVIALAIGLSVVARSLSEISTSTNTENSARAFSAAEAGIEKALKDISGIGIGETGNFGVDSLSNRASATVSWDADLPKAQTALEYPPFGKESFAQFWLTDLDFNCNNVNSRCYSQDSFELFFGDTKQDYTPLVGYPENKPAIEVYVILERAKVRGGGYYGNRYFYDSASGRSSFNGCDSGSPFTALTNNNTVGSAFYCKVRVPPGTGSYKTEGGTTYSNDIPTMVRVRILYTSSSHPVAIKPTGGSSLPLQANIIVSRGISSDVQRNLQLLQVKSVLPHLFDYALFAGSGVSK